MKKGGKIYPAVLLVSILSSLSVYAQNQKVNGYRGIWYSTGPENEYGFKLSGGFATFGSRHLPTAVYSPEAKKTFFVYGGTTSYDESHLLIMASFYDHVKKQVPRPVVVFDKQGVRNPYDNASLAIDNNGYIWVFVSGWLRTRPGIIFKSKSPYSIDDFENILIKEMSFPQPWCLRDSGFIMVFSKTLKGLDIFFSASRDGFMWSRDKIITAMGGNGHLSGYNNGKLYVVFNYHPQGNIDRRTNLYLLYTDDMGRTWKTINGGIVNTPVRSIKNEALVRDFQSEGKLVHIYDLNFDGKGDPVILACTSMGYMPGPSGDPREWIVVTRKGNAWNFSKVCETDNNFDAATIHINNDKWLIAGPSDSGSRKYTVGGEMVLWESYDEGVTWSKTRNITSGSRYNMSYPRRPLNAGKDFYIWWSDGNPEEISESGLYFSNNRLKKVWKLPYLMKKDYERPERVK